MDLFIINRYNDSKENVDLVNQEHKHLQILKQKIEERKKASALLNKSDDVITLQQQTTENIVVDDGNQKNIEDKENNEKNDADEVPVQLKKKPIKDKPSHEFKVLGINDFGKKDKVKRVLPHWLSHPVSVSTNLHNLSCPVQDVPWLHETLKTTLTSQGITELFPVQQQVIPHVLSEHSLPKIFWPRDICVSAPTGSGKTLAFVLPIIQVLMKEIGCYVRALIVLPVQELATQVAHVFRKYCTKTGLKVSLLSGSIPLRQEQHQIVRYTESEGWVSEAHILVCTAGRLVEHLQNTKGFSLKHLKFLVIDEADRIMDNIQNDWLYHLDKHIKLENELITGKVPTLSFTNLCSQKPPPHKLLFSATLSQDPEKLEQWGLFQPILFSASSSGHIDNIRKYTTPEELSEEYIICSADRKPLLLFYFLVEKKWKRVLCFTNSGQTAHRLTLLLNKWAGDALRASELSAALDRSTREKVLKQFTQSEINVLIVTDALARGIDVPHCDHVVSYDPPRNIRTYIHRAGRSGRAGRKGHALTILLHNQLNLFKDLLRLTRKSDIPQIEVQEDVFDRLSEDYRNALEDVKQQISMENNTKIKKSVELKRGSKQRKRKYEKSNVQSKKNKIVINHE